MMPSDQISRRFNRQLMVHNISAAGSEVAHVGIQHRDRDRSLFDEQPQPQLAVSQCRFSLLPLNRGGDQVRDGFQKPDVMLIEPPLPACVDAKHAIRFGVIVGRTDGELMPLTTPISRNSDNPSNRVSVAKSSTTTGPASSETK